MKTVVFVVLFFVSTSVSASSFFVVYCFGPVFYHSERYPNQPVKPGFADPGHGTFEIRSGGGLILADSSGRYFEKYTPGEFSLDSARTVINYQVKRPYLEKYILDILSRCDAEYDKDTLSEWSFFNYGSKNIMAITPSKKVKIRKASLVLHWISDTTRSYSVTITDKDKWKEYFFENSKCCGIFIPKWVWEYEDFQHDPVAHLTINTESYAYSEDLFLHLASEEEEEALQNYLKMPLFSSGSLFSLFILAEVFYDKGFYLETIQIYENLLRNSSTPSLVEDYYLLFAHESGMLKNIYHKSRR